MVQLTRMHRSSGIYGKPDPTGVRVSGVFHLSDVLGHGKERTSGRTGHKGFYLLLGLLTLLPVLVKLQAITVMLM